MIQYAKEAQFARAHLLRLYNDLLVFVEDATCQNMHVRIISKILGPGGKLTHVFPLYGRSNVIDAAVQDDGRDARRLYLVDGDFDQLTLRSIPKCDRLHRIAAYSMENWLITEAALAEIAAECATDDSHSTLVSRINFARNRHVVVRCLLTLFEHYAVVARLNLPIETVSYSVMRLIETDQTLVALSPDAITARIRNVRRRIVAAVGWGVFKRELSEIKARAEVVPDQLSILSGKDYLLPLAHTYLRVTMNLRDSFNGFRVRLARHFEPESTPDLTSFVRAALANTFRLQE